MRILHQIFVISHFFLPFSNIPKREKKYHSKKKKNDKKIYKRKIKKTER
jgi:hypothetical protein